MTTESSLNVSIGEHVDLLMARKLHWASSAVMGPTIALLGVIGNVLSIVVWTRKAMRSSTGHYLIALAAVDISVLVLFMLTDSILYLYPLAAVNPAYGKFYAFVGYPFFYFSVIFSIWMLVAVTVDRFIHVWFPARAKDFCGRKRVFLVTISILFLCFGVNFPHFYFYQSNTPSQTLLTSYTLTDFGKGAGGLAYSFWVHCIFLVLVPWISISALNILILRRVRISRMRAKLDKQKLKQVEVQLTRVLLTVTFTFLILMVFQCVTQCFKMINPSTANEQMVEEAFAIAKLGIVINSSVNFILYCLSGKRFRRELSLVLRIGCRNNRVVPFDTKSSSLQQVRTNDTKSSSL